VRAMRGPSYLRLAGSRRTGVIEIPCPVDSPSALVDDRLMERRQDAIHRQLQGWKAPILSDDTIEMYARLFLMKPGHELVPFFLWIDDATRATAHR